MHVCPVMYCVPEVCEAYGEQLECDMCGQSFNTVHQYLKFKYIFLHVYSMYMYMCLTYHNMCQCNTQFIP